MTVVLIFPLWVLPCLLRTLMSGWAGWGFGVLLSDVLGALVVGFLTNNYKFGVLVYLGATALELSMIFVGHEMRLALWVGNLIPALVAIFYAQQIYINMGD